MEVEWVEVVKQRLADAGIDLEGKIEVKGGVAMRALEGVDMDFARIQSDTVAGSQELVFTEIRTYPGKRVSLRVRIKRDHYDRKSFGVVEKWTDHGWAEVATKHINHLHCHEASPYASDPKWDLFRADAEEFFMAAITILEGLW